MADLDPWPFDDEVSARRTFERLVAVLADAKAQIEMQERRTRGCRKFVEALVMMYPELAELLPEDWATQPIAKFQQKAVNS